VACVRHSHVGKQRPVDGLGDCLHFFGTLRRLDEEHVGACRCIGFRPADRLVETEARAGISAGDDQEIIAAPAVGRHFDLLDHIRHGHHASIGRVAAFLREFLILELDGRDAGILIAANGVANIEQSAIAGIRIGNDRRAGKLHHLRDALDHVAISRNARIRNAEG
jgi:hypothetical protein